MKKLLLSFLLGCAGLAHATSVLFPIDSMFGGMAYGQTITVQAVNTLYSDGYNLYAGTYTSIPSTGTNPIVSLQPNSYLLTIAGVVRPVRFNVPASTNVLNLVSLIPGGTVFYFGTNGFANLVPGTGMAFVTNSDGSITLNSAASLSLVFTNGPSQLTNGVLAISTNYDALGTAWTTFAFNATSGATAFNLAASSGLPFTSIQNYGAILTNNYAGNANLNGSNYLGGNVTEGAYTVASGQNSHAEGSITTASGLSSHSEGGNTIASGFCSFAGGWKSSATNDLTFVWGDGSTPVGSTTNNQVTLMAANGYRLLGGPIADSTGNFSAATNEATKTVIAAAGYQTAAQVGGIISTSAIPVANVTGLGNGATADTNAVIAVAVQKASTNNPSGWQTAAQVTTAIGGATNVLTGSNAPTSAFTGASFTGTHYGNAGPLTNLTADSVIGTLNPTISSNAVVSYNDAPVQTNMLLQPFAIGGMIASAAASSNCAVMDLGDSLTEGANQPSALKIFGQRLRATYGDSGVAGANVPISGWNNNPTVFNRVPPTNVWIRNLIGEIIPSDGTNACYSTLQNGGDYSNVVNQVGLCYVSAPQSSNFAVCIWSPSAGVTNFYKITNDNSASINFYRTNWAVAPAYDWTIGCSSLGGTNYLVNSILMNTNHGVQFWTHGYAGYSPAHIASVGSNMWAQIVAAINPRVVIYHGLHLGNSDSSGWWGGTGDTSLQTTTNALWALMGSHSTNTQVVVVGVPPNSGGDQRVVNYYLKLACQSFGWYYLDVWSAFPDYNTEVSAGMFDGANGDYVHPSLAGSYARSGVMWQKMGLAPAAWNGVDLRNASGTISLGSLPSGVLTNNQFGVTLNGTTLGGSYGGVALTGGGVYGFNNGVLIYGGGLEMRYNGGCVNFTQGQNGVNGATFIDTLTNNSASIVATNNISMLSGGTYYGNGSGLTNLQASAVVGNQGRVVTTSGPSTALTTGINYSPLGNWNTSLGVGAGMIAGFVGTCSNFCFSENLLGATNISVYIGTNAAFNSETYIGTIFPVGAGFNYTNWTTTFYNNNPTNQIFLVLSNWSATTTVQARLQLTFTY